MVDVVDFDVLATDQCLAKVGVDKAEANGLCLASEPCAVDEDCQEGDTCIPANNAGNEDFQAFVVARVFDDRNVAVVGQDINLICSADSAIGSLAGFTFLFIFISVALVTCVYTAIQRGIRLRKSLVERREKKRAKAANNIQGDAETPLQAKCEELYIKSNELERSFNAMLEDVNKLYIQEDMRQTLFMFRFMVIATMSCASSSDQQTLYMFERRLWFLCSYLEQATQGLWYAMNPDNGVQANKQALLQGQQLLARTAEYFALPSPYGQVGCPEILRKKYDDKTFGRNSPNFKQLESKAMSFKPIFSKVTQTSKTKKQPTLFRQARRFKLFYGFYTALGTSIFLAFTLKIGGGNTAFDLTARSPDFINRNFLLDRLSFGGGFGQTFLPIPPQYTFGPKGSPLQTVMIPVLYGFMHNALLCLGLLPLPLCRGLWRDIVTRFPGIKKYMPVDDLLSVHRQLAYGLFSFIGIGAVVFLITMVPECVNGVPNSCLAFTPNVDEYFDPVENVLMLRFSVFALWPWMAVLYFARDGPPFPLSQSKALRSNWFEISYYMHVFIAHATLVLALVSRFEVFYPTAFGWITYWIDWTRETLFHSKRADLVDAQLFGRARDGVPTSMRLKFVPQTEFKTGAGQYFYIKIPQIDAVYHPFTLCSASNDQTVQAHVGIIAGKNDWQRNKTGKFVASEWESKTPTWTYKLFKIVSSRGTSSIPAVIRGPYGSSFNDCFDPSYGGAVVCAAGTGLSAAESVLRESLERRKAGMPGPTKLWVVYSCREEDSLIWAWERIISLLVKAVEDRVLDANTLTSRASMFDWIGIQMYVTQSTPELLQQFTQLNKEQGSKVFNLRDSIFLRQTIQRGGKKAPVNRNSDGKSQVSALGPAGRASMGSSYSGASGSSGNMRSGAGSAFGGSDTGSDFGMQPRLAGMRQAMGTIARGQYSDLDLGQGSRREGVSAKVRDWLLNKVLAGSLDDENTHIERFLNGAIDTLAACGAARSLSVGFCGPGPLSLTISEACRVVASQPGVVRVDYTAESQ